ncbi:MAG: COG4705 family protein, partial [Actinomycetota bacterium]
TSDFLAHKFGPITAGLVGAVVFAVAISLQFWVRRYVTWVYWLAVAMVAVFGTMAADGLHIELHIPYAVTTSMYVVGLAAVFAVWYWSERTLDIHSINTPRREFFYWTTVLATFALGTAAGDMSAVTLNLGYFASVVAFAVLIVIPATGYRWLRMNEVLAFWFAYVLTRPLGASIADWVSFPTSRGGLGFGDGHFAILLSLLIVACVSYIGKTGKDRQRSPGSGPAAGPRLVAAEEGEN